MWVTHSWDAGWSPVTCWALSVGWERGDVEMISVPGIWAHHLGCYAEPLSREVADWGHRRLSLGGRRLISSWGRRTKMVLGWYTRQPLSHISFQSKWYKSLTLTRGTTSPVFEVSHVTPSSAVCTSSIRHNDDTSLICLTDVRFKSQNGWKSGSLTVRFYINVV